MNRKVLNLHYPGMIGQLLIYDNVLKILHALTPYPLQRRYPASPDLSAPSVHPFCVAWPPGLDMTKAKSIPFLARSRHRSSKEMWQCDSFPKMKDTIKSLTVNLQIV